jgi:glycosyltransferase involved in cell wall biosynthesis
MRILVATDAWHPQINGVVRTLSATAAHARKFGTELFFLTPDDFTGLPLPGYPEIKLALPLAAKVRRKIADTRPDAIHIATEGPVGLAARRYCRRHNVRFTTSFHTAFPAYVAARSPIPEAWVWRYLRWFHDKSDRVMAASSVLAAELQAQGFQRIVRWSRGVDTALFKPEPDETIDLPRPIFLNVGRVAVEKNLEAFLALDLPGTKVVVGDGPARGALAKKYPKAVFLGIREGKALARIYAAADVFVFPSRTDTFGLVLLEALASGLPVAALPIPGVAAVIGTAPVCVLDHDLRAACLQALRLPRHACRAFAEGWSWDNCTRHFIRHAAWLSPAEDFEPPFAFEPRILSG